MNSKEMTAYGFGKGFKQTMFSRLSKKIQECYLDCEIENIEIISEYDCSWPFYYANVYLVISVNNTPISFHRKLRYTDNMWIFIF